MKKNNNKGFTLMEMLIVVAIIAILVAIAIPTFTGSLNQAREAADQANVRAAYAEISAEYLNDPAATTMPTSSTSAMQADGSLAIPGVSPNPVTWSKGNTVSFSVTSAGVFSASAG